MSSYIVKKSITIHTKPHEVWDALTNPERTKNYFFKCRVYSDWTPGSDIVFKGRMLLFIKIELKGKILKADPGKLLQYTLKNGSGKKPEAGESRVTDVLTYAKGKTTVSISDDVGGGQGAEKRFRRSNKGWNKILDGLKKEVEENGRADK